MAQKGLQLSNQRISSIFRNPFYCGLIAHKALSGILIEGVQEKAVSRELFLKVNDILAGNHKSGYSLDPENEQIPLKRFLKCDNCGKYLRAYKARKNQKYYYKCCTLGCGCNKRAEELHSRFKEMMDKYVLKSEDEGLLYLIKQQMVITYNKSMAGRENECEVMDSKIDEINIKVNRLEERFVMEEITRDMYLKYADKLREERREIEAAMNKIAIGVSNLGMCI